MLIPPQPTLVEMTPSTRSSPTEDVISRKHLQLLRNVTKQSAAQVKCPSAGSDHGRQGGKMKPSTTSENGAMDESC